MAGRLSEAQLLGTRGGVSAAIVGWESSTTPDG